MTIFKFYVYVALVLLQSLSTSARFYCGSEGGIFANSDGDDDCLIINQEIGYDSAFRMDAGTGQIVSVESCASRVAALNGLIGGGKVSDVIQGGEGEIECQTINDLTVLVSTRCSSDAWYLNQLLQYTTPTTTQTSTQTSTATSTATTTATTTELIVTTTPSSSNALRSCIMILCVSISVALTATF
eukprot:m.161339 g.161339  ORF g.161339 m.161339 type:complete len:186 (-) comp31227_c0_seq1:103-660(-)